MRLFATGAMNWVMGKALARRRADRGEDGHQGHRAGPEHRRAAQRRDPQERAQVRRGDERAAQGDLQAPRPDPRRRRPARRGASSYLAEAVDGTISTYCVADHAEEWDLEGLHTEIATYWPITATARRPRAVHRPPTSCTSVLMGEATAYYEAREEEFGAETMREVERQVMLRIIDQQWREHLYEMDYLQEGINLRAMGQKDPLVEWQREGFEMFGAMMQGIATGLREVRHARAGHGGRAQARHADADRQRAATPLPTDPSEAPSTMAGRGPGPGRGRGRRGPARRRCRGGRPDPGREVRVGQDPPQRALPVRLGQEVQAVPRRRRSRLASRCRTSPTTSPRCAGASTRRTRYLRIDELPPRRPQLETEATPARPLGRPRPGPQGQRRAVVRHRRPRALRLARPLASTTPRRSSSWAARRATIASRPRSPRPSTSLARGLRRARAAGAVHRRARRR